MNPKNPITVQAHMISARVVGVGAQVLEVAAGVTPGLPSFEIIGLSEAAKRETRVRVQCAMEASGFPMPVARVVVEITGRVPAAGAALDLPIALALIAAASGEKFCVGGAVAAIGELSLSGEVRPVRGALAMAEELKASEVDEVLFPPISAEEASFVKDLLVRRVRTLADAVGFLRDGSLHDERAPSMQPGPITHPPEPDFVDIGGAAPAARLAVEVALAGGFRGVLLVGPPGAGKTTIVSADAQTRMPACPFVVATAEPCPCGRRGGGSLACACTAEAVLHHTRNVEAFANKLNLVCAHMTGATTNGTTSSAMRDRIATAHSQRGRSERFVAAVAAVLGDLEILDGHDLAINFTPSKALGR